MKPIVTFGEALIDLLSTNSATYAANPGGAPANVAAAAALLGSTSYLIGKVGRDAFGDAVRRKLEEAGVRTDYLGVSPWKNTPLAVVSLSSEGNRDFAFYRTDTADLDFRPEEIPVRAFDGAIVFHFGSLTLTSEPCRSATLHAAREAKRRGCLVSYDPNLRLRLWDSEAAARERLLEAMDLADVVKINEDELLFLSEAPTDATRQLSLEEAAQALRERYRLKALLVTLGPEGCLSASDRGLERFAGVRAKAVDTTGAGDAFVGALLNGIARALPDADRWADLMAAPGLWERIVRGAVAYSALSTERYGAIDSYGSEVPATTKGE